MKSSLLAVWHWIREKWYRAVIIVALLILGGAAIAFQVMPTQSQATYQTTTVQPATIASTVTASGRVSTTGSTSITTQATGQISKLYVKQGDVVKLGQKIADITLDLDGKQQQTTVYASLLSARNSLASAQNDLKTLDASMWSAHEKFQNDALTNGLPVYDANYIQENDAWLAAEQKYKNQQTVIAQSQAQLSNASIAYQSYSSSVTAPVAGTINNLAIASGMSLVDTSTTTSSSNSNTTFTIGSITTDGKTVVSLSVSEVDIAKIKEGQSVNITADSVAGKTFPAHVSGIDKTGSVSSNVATYTVLVTLDDTNTELLSNMAVSAEFIIEQKDSALVVPASAITTSNGKKTVLVLQNGQPTPVAVETGISNDTETEITSGLQSGDEIVTATTTTSSGTTKASGATTSPFSSTTRGFGGGGAATFRAL